MANNAGPDDNVIRNAQFIKCGEAVRNAYDNCRLLNSLITECTYGFDGGTLIRCENVTFAGLYNLDDHYEPTLCLTNCLMVAVTNIYGSIYGGANNKFLSSATGVFQTASAANYYLATNCPADIRNAGTTNIDPDLLTEIRTMTTYAPQEGGFPDTNAPDLGYHYPVNEDSDYDGLPDWWEWKWFGSFALSGTNLDSGGVNTLLHDYQNTNDPNVITFTFSFPNQYVTTNSLTGLITILGGVPSSIAILVDSTNFTSATWTAYTSSNVAVNFSTNQGAHEIWIGLRGLPADAQQTWENTTLILDSIPPTITITNPANNVSFNSSRVDLKEISLPVR